MKKSITIAFIFLISMAITACKEKAHETNVNEVKQYPNAVDSLRTSEVDATFGDNVDDALAEKIKTYILTQFLSENDLRAIPDSDRKFQINKTDLNNDGRTEIFVTFRTPYFCGTGGCTLLLLDDALQKINKFTVTRNLYTADSFQNGWRVLMTESGGNWIKLIHEQNSYPSNPSLLESTGDAPNESAEVIFDEDTPKKTYKF